MNKLRGKVNVWLLMGATAVIAGFLVANQGGGPPEGGPPGQEQAQVPAAEQGAPEGVGKPEEVGPPAQAGPKEDRPSGGAVPTQTGKPAVPAAGAPADLATAHPKGSEVLSLGRSLRLGSEGNDVRGMQELLAKLPDLYPQGLITGFFGSASEQAIRRLQERFGLESIGVVDERSREVLEKLAAAISRKEKPRITDISPASISLGSKMLLAGTGFTFEGNAIFVKGRIITKNLSSPDGSSLEFFVAPNIPCLPDGSACPIKVLNKNGISNAKPIKLVRAEFPPEPTEPPPPPPPPPQPVINSISPSYGKAGAEINLYGSGFASNSNSINLAGAQKVVSGLSSSDGKTLMFSMPASPCKVLEPCSVSVTNVNGTSNAANFTMTQEVRQVTLTAPNGGEKYVQGVSSPISWSGGTDAVRVALVEAGVAQGSDPADFVVGWISISSLPDATIRWDAKEACDVTLTTCFPVAPGDYKILAVSENEFGMVEIAPDGSGNWDLSNNSFSVLAPVSVTVLSPNGGEKLIYGATQAISWKVTSLLSQSVKIDLLKGGVFSLRLANIVPQSAPDGTFFYNWTVPLSLQAGADYAIEVADTDTNNPSVKDASDSPFSIGPQASIVVTAPNGGELLYKGFQATVRWNSGNILSKAVNIDLYKGGAFLRRLAENVSQKLYSWSTQTYVSGSGFNYIMNVPTDIVDGSDYTLIVSDFADGTTRDASDGAFTISTLPDPVTFSGRVIERFSNNPMAGFRLSNWPAGGGVWSFVATTSPAGEFSVKSTTSDLTSTSTLKGAVTAWPNCYMNWMEMLYRKSDSMYVWSHQFDLLSDKIFLLPGADVKLGDVPVWPAIGLYFYADASTLGSPGVSYPDSSYGGYQILALEYDLRVSVYNQATGAYVLSPLIKIPFANGCTPKSLTLLGGVFAWEPYNVRSAYSLPYSLTVGSSVNTTFNATGGVAPYTWDLYYGPLPTGLALNRSTGQVTGIVTTPGIYKFQIKITDANGVNGGTWPITVTVK